MKKIECLFHTWVKLINIEDFMNLSLVSLNMSDILGINVVTVIFLVLCINFTKIHTDSEVILLITLLFGRIFSLVKRFH